MLGFYVDLDEDGEKVLSPADIAPETIPEDFQIAAQVVAMFLIQEHSRMKLDTTTAYEDTQVQQRRLLPISHPDE